MPTAAGSPSSSTTITTTSTAVDVTENPVSNRNEGGGGAPAASATQSWWESISRARSRILSLASVLSSPDLASLADSDRPARSLLDSPLAYAALSAAFSAPSSGSGDDPLCHWLYDTFQSSDSDLRLVALSFLPLLAGHYLSRVVSSSSSSSAANPPSLAGFEAVLLALYAAEVKARAGKPVLVSVPDLSLPSLYHTPRPSAPSRQPPSAATAPPPRPSVGILSPPLEPQIAVKSTKRACIVAVALDSYYKNISFMPSRSKIDLCEFVAAWAGQDCPCRFEFDDDDLNRSSLCSSSPSSSSSSPQVRIFFEDNGGIGGAAEEMRKLAIQEGPNGNHCDGEDEGGGASRRGSRVPLPWELLQPVLRILGHCLLAPLNPQEVRDSASMAVRCVYGRASHDLLPQAILASRSLIQLDKSARKAAKPEIAPSNSSKPNTPSKPKKPEVLLVSK
ncbi:uncharacterized protein LOC135614770 [Musa acuminata AAA Group]|uniref:uncharacterized protein LOC135614770 n=1 Tax=Musa acuminata AAA Group TaxID=214697 RepID=UPI0031D18A76